MENYGLVIYPEILHGKPFGMNKTRSFNYIKSIEIDHGEKFDVYFDRKYQVPERTAGGNIIVVPVKASAVWKDRYGWIDWCLINGIAVGDDYINVSMYKSYSSQDTPTGYSAKVHIYETMPAISCNSYGLFIDDATDYTLINDISKLGYVVHRETVWISSDYTLPWNTPNRVSQIVMANWNSADAVLEYVEDENKIISNGVGVLVNIIIVQSGFTPPVDVGSYGLAMWNSIGNVVISNKWPPMITHEYFNADSIPQALPYDMSMVSLGRYGCFFKGSYPHKAYNGGLKMSGDRVWVAAGSYISEGNHKGTMPSDFPAKCPVIAIDGSRYF
ncbi:TPA: DUF6453 family protein [Serratia marcescens]